MEKKIFKVESVKKLIEFREMDNIIDCILNVELKATPIGEGGNAFIFIPEDESLQSVCIKKSKKNPYMIYNNIEEECEIQKEAKNNGICTPLTLLSFTTKDKEEYFLMERINGYSIKDILENNNLLPKKFNYNNFCKSLDEQIEKMHNKKGVSDGIYHRDLHSGNIMINEEGLPVIIDFGTSTKSSNNDSTYEDDVLMYNSKKERYELVKNIFSDDIEMIKKIKKDLIIFSEYNA